MRLSQSLTLMAAFALASPLAAGQGQEVELSRSDERAVAYVQGVLGRHFENPFAQHVSEHFVILHNAAAERAAARAALLERTHQRFYETFEGAGFKLRPLHRRMTCVLFAEQADFAHYALRVDRLDMGWSGGYYSSRTNNVALFEAPHWLAPAPAPGSAAPAPGSASSGAADEPAPVSDPAAASATPAFSLATTTHEAAHQLAFNSGLQQRGVMYPLWASEGLATSFEREHPDQPLGPEHLNPTRHRALRHGWRQGRLLPLEEFVTLTRVPTHDANQVNVVYAQAWGLFRFLFMHERAALVRYLEALSHLERGARSPDMLRAEFVAAFGPIADLEHDWSQHLATTLGE